MFLNYGKLIPQWTGWDLFLKGSEPAFSPNEVFSSPNEPTFFTLNLCPAYPSEICLPNLAQ